ncbi:MAG: hypothetical protein QOI26_2216, partial [Pseudonocardiales bacterium]|nr:hypothetical protein [Pseudonocardiales bacterium]
PGREAAPQAPRLGPGPWLAHVDGHTDPSNAPAFRTKRDAVAYATKRLAIADYHAAA